MRFAVLGEDKSDVESLAAIIKKLFGGKTENPNISVKGKGFGGCGELCKKGAGAITSFLRDDHSTRFVICHDADGPNPKPARNKVMNMIVKPAGLNKSNNKLILIPVQEFEAWLIADEEALATTIQTLQIKAVSEPERQESPKEWLIDKSRKRREASYFPRTHNSKIAKELNLDKVAKKCPSFRPLVEFVSKQC